MEDSTICKTDKSFRYLSLAPISFFDCWCWIFVRCWLSDRAGHGLFLPKCTLLLMDGDENEGRDRHGMALGLGELWPMYQQLTRRCSRIPPPLPQIPTNMFWNYTNTFCNSNEYLDAGSMMFKDTTTTAVHWLKYLRDGEEGKFLLVAYDSRVSIAPLK